MLTLAGSAGRDTLAIAVLAYAETVHMAFHLHRADLLTRCGWSRPRQGRQPALVRPATPGRTTVSHLEYTASNNANSLGNANDPDNTPRAPPPAPTAKYHSLCAASDSPDMITNTLQNKQL
jgi:hypothetical protein